MVIGEKKSHGCITDTTENVGHDFLFYRIIKTFIEQIKNMIMFLKLLATFNNKIDHSRINNIEAVHIEVMSE